MERERDQEGGWRETEHLQNGKSEPKFRVERGDDGETALQK